MLLTSRPSVVTASSENEAPAGGSRSATRPRPGGPAPHRAPGRRAQVAEEDPHDRPEEVIEEREEQEPDDPDRDDEAVHQAGQARVRRRAGGESPWPSPALPVVDGLDDDRGVADDDLVAGPHCQLPDRLAVDASAVGRLLVGQDQEPVAGRESGVQAGRPRVGERRGRSTRPGRSSACLRRPRRGG